MSWELMVTNVPWVDKAKAKAKVKANRMMVNMDNALDVDTNKYINMAVRTPRCPCFIPVEWRWETLQIFTC